MSQRNTEVDDLMGRVRTVLAGHRHMAETTSTSPQYLMRQTGAAVRAVVGTIMDTDAFATHPDAVKTAITGMECTGIVETATITTLALYLASLGSRFMVEPTVFTDDCDTTEFGPGGCGLYIGWDSGDEDRPVEVEFLGTSWECANVLNGGHLRRAAQRTFPGRELQYTLRTVVEVADSIHAA